MSKISRQQAIEEFVLIGRENGQLFFNQIQTALQEGMGENYSAVALLRMLKLQGPMSQRQIAELLCHSEAAISRQVSVSLEKGYIEVVQNEEDHRTTTISLTGSGEEIAAKATELIMSRCSEILAPLSDELLEQLITANKELHQSLRKYETGKNA